ncbi:MoeA, N-terminal and linker domain-containing protein [Aspergillus aurantiobrunneus]
MALAYADAVELVEQEAIRQRDSATSAETCSIYNACDRVVSQTIYSLVTTPAYDTSAMDGFALSSVATQSASPECQVTFEVVATTRAGDKPHSTREDETDGIPSCVEIMTGAPFPLGPQSERYDCCVPVEAVVVTDNRVSNRHYVTLSGPAKRCQHRRLAGGDFSKGDTIIAAGECIRPQHVMAMASVGLADIPVIRKPRIAVFSTGCELLAPDTVNRPHPFMIPDVNGPYLTTTLRQWGADVDFRGLVRDNPDAMEEAVLTALGDEYDVIVTSGAVSAGRCDFIPGLVNRIHGRTVFHRVAVKPGHPILFSMLPRGEDETAFFGLPGNPVAAAACLRFFVLRYLKALQGQKAEEPQRVRLELSSDDAKPCNGTKGKSRGFRIEPDIFRPAVLTQCGQQVRIIEDHSPGKTRPFLLANCWAHIPSGVSELEEGSSVGIYPC